MFLILRWCLVLLGLSLPLGTSLAKDPPVDASIRKQAREAPLALRFEGTTAAECRRWQEAFAARLRSSLGPHAPPKVWQTTVEKTEDHEDHILQELSLTAPGHPPLPVSVLLPKAKPDGKRAGILALHGHGPRGNDAIARGNSGRELVRRGFVVVCPCMQPFGKRLGDPAAYGKQDPCAVTFVRLQLLGKVLIAENLRDCLWALEYLARRDDVDPHRLGCVGLSYGGRMTMLAAALEPRIKVAVISGALNVLQERIEVRYSCGAQVIPGLLQYGDVPEIASLIAPRPAVWEAGLQDKLIDPIRADAALVRMRQAYRALGADKNLMLDRFDGGHVWSWRVAMPVLERELLKKDER